MQAWGINDYIQRINELEETIKIQELRQKGIIADVCLICPTKEVKHEIIIALDKCHIKKVPILVTPLIEKDKIFMITDKQLVENIKNAIGFNYEV